MKHNITLSFNINDKVFYMRKNQIQTGRIKAVKLSIDCSGMSEYYTVVECTEGESGKSFGLGYQDLFDTKEDLLKNL